MAAGLVAAAFSFFPIIGEFVAAPAAFLAVVSGSVAVSWVERGLATNPAEPRSALVSAAAVLVFVATSDIAS